MLLAVYKVGSQLFLNKPHDKDVLYVYETDQEMIEQLKSYKPAEGLDIHFTTPQRETRTFIGMYSLHYAQHEAGEHIKAVEEHNIFTDDVKGRYKELVLKTIPRLHLNNKLWYHIYIAMCLYKKGKYYKFTKAEKGTFQKIHDEGVDEELKNKLINYFNNL